MSYTKDGDGAQSSHSYEDFEQLMEELKLESAKTGTPLTYDRTQINSDASNPLLFPNMPLGQETATVNTNQTFQN
jgi:hypothetical protein